ncbi:MAG: hypothetical protein IPM71_07590 [Bacteroidota bacterium]|nr:MAG: hypothetical protein IPM71_07590 [Bacteroidota bacterium]
MPVFKFHKSALLVASLISGLSLVLILLNRLFLLNPSRIYFEGAFILIVFVLTWYIQQKNQMNDSSTKNASSLLPDWKTELIDNLAYIQVYLLDKNLKPIYISKNHSPLTLASLLSVLLKDPDSFSISGENSVFMSDFLLSMEMNLKLEVTFFIPEGSFEVSIFCTCNNPENEKQYLLYVSDRSIKYNLVKTVITEKSSIASLSEKHKLLNRELEETNQLLQTYNEELLENKERYAAFIQQTSEAVYRFDLKKPLDISLPIDMQVQAIFNTAYLAESNPAFSEIYHLKNDGNFYGKKTSEVYPDINQAEIQDLMRELVQHNYMLKDHETIEYDAQGRMRYFLNNIVGIVEKNRLIRYWGTKLDTTKLKEHERELIKAKKLAEESDKLKTAFLANMSHEIRTPLNGILGFSELLCNKGLNDDKREKYFHIIQASNQQLLRIINDILDISRIQTGQLSITKEKIQLNGLIGDIETWILHEIKLKNKKIEFFVHKGFADGEDKVNTDRERLYQVITNLINNAIKFTEKGSVTLSYAAKSKSILEFCVSDTGIGIPDQYLASIFDQFRQVEEFSSRKYGGTGLGLSISKGLVEVLGGYISVESEVGVGSTFRFTIKYAE